MAHTKDTLIDKITGVSKGWERRDKTSAEAAHEMAKKKGGKGKKQPTFFSDTGKSHGKGHRIHDNERERKRWEKHIKKHIKKD